MKTLILPAAIALALVAGSAQAAPHSIRAMIKEYDLNADQKVSRDEFDAVRKIRYLTTDADGNGTLNKAEYVGEFETRLKKDLESESDAAKAKEEYDRQMRQADVRFGVLDTDKDAKMTFDEYVFSGHQMFNRQDIDKDGLVTLKDSDLLKTQQAEGKGDDFISP
ncbi:MULTISPECIES: hypothetical protein [Asticcacaulis]|uniref:hypothetical protein n=1 Tax=Asticcacaulis TaxID=76890 RepID=UPI001AEA741C|nr:MULTISPECIES: hypothetical protein [Asticcacaulis]MBP2159180.1 hypothetical protein [Asticcacaulis solisilvae]MDR6800225.1 hypothetical protein [Asticcacaulis sp. BE141]